MSPATPSVTHGVSSLDVAHARPTLDALWDELIALRAEMIDSECDECLKGVARVHEPSARNLIDYTTLRRHDIRGLQDRLAQVGLSSLGRSEPHVRVNLERVLGLLALARQAGPFDPPEMPPVGFRQGQEILARNTTRLLGEGRPDRRVRIMVTLPTEAASDPSHVESLVAAGMDCARINCAHDDEAAWGAMIDHVRRAAKQLSVDCRILMDLGGPKLRTGAPLDGSEAILVRPGDRIRLLSETRKGSTHDDVPEITCQEPRIFSGVRVGESIWFDDGKIGGEIEGILPDALFVRVTQVRERGRKLGAEKGINLPDSDLQLPAFSATDLDHLEFVTRHADLVGLSFVQRTSDVRELQDAMRSFGAMGLGVVLKIETREGFENLPLLILEAMRFEAIGVMIARGDLAVELGFARLAEVQEEILWIAEAAHVPTIWATQVLESLAKKGELRRGEITDAAMSGRAEAVMLNKGPYMVDAIRTLDDILGRMQSHQSKKRSLLRQLSVSESLE